MAALEALSCGLPSVLTRGTGMDELAGFGTAVAWCDPDPASIADALKRIINDRHAVDTAACARLAAERFGARQGWNSLCKLYGIEPGGLRGP